MRTSLFVFGALLVVVGLMMYNPESSPMVKGESLTVPATMEPSETPPVSMPSTSTDCDVAAPESCEGGVCPVGPTSPAPMSPSVSSNELRPRFGQRLRARVRSWRPFGGFFARRFGG